MNARISTTLRQLSAGLIGLVMLPASAADRELNILNWSELIPQERIDQFAQSQQVAMRYDLLDSDEVLETKVLIGNSGYDVVYPSSSFMVRQIQAGGYAKIDWSKIPNRKNLDPDLLSKLQTHDPKNQFGVPFLWGTDGILVNVKAVRKILGKDANLNSWDLLFNPDVVSKLNACGVSYLDSPSEVFSLMLAYLGRDPNSEKAEDLQAAFAQLKKVRPFVNQVNSSYRDQIAGGDLCVAMAWSGDAGIIRRMARENKQELDIQYFTPTGQTPIWFTMMGIPKDAPNKAEAHAWINYLLEPSVASDIANYNSYPTAVGAARALIDPAITSDTTVYPPQEMIKSFFVFAPIGAEATKLTTSLWQKLWSR